MKKSWQEQISHTEGSIPRQRRRGGSGAKEKVGIILEGDGLGQLPPRTLALPSPKQQ